MTLIYINKDPQLSTSHVLYITRS